jgi:spore germination protein KC
VEAERIIPKNKQPEERGLGIKRDSLELRMAGNAIFADDKLVDWLDVEETKGYMLAVNKAKPGIIDTEHEEVNKKMAFQNLSSKSKIIPQISDDGRLSFLIKAKIRANLVEQMDILRLDKEEVQKSLEDLLAATVKDAARKAVEKAQKNKTDIFGMGVELYRTYPKLWKEKYKDNWSEIFARVPVEIQVEAKINNIGVILETLERKGLVE